MKHPTSPAGQEVAHLEKLRAQLAADIEEFHQKEASMREYEQRLRHLIEMAANGSRATHTASPFLAQSTQPGAELDAAWEKYQRAHALLEAARRGMADDRLALRQREEEAAKREETISRREAWIEGRETELKAQATAAATEAAKPKPKVKRSFTTAPFLAAKEFLSPNRP